MKTNLYIFLILLLSFSYGNAQSAASNKVTNETVVSQNNDKVSGDVEAVKVISTEKEEATIEPSIIEGSMARANSDYKVYKKILGNIKNVDFLFPKTYKERTA